MDKSNTLERHDRHSKVAIGDEQTEDYEKLLEVLYEQHEYEQ